MRALLLLACLASVAGAETIDIDAKAKSTPFPHYWEQMFGSGRASLSMRESYREDLRAIVGATAARYVRFHGIFMDELGVYDEDGKGNAVYNFSYVDEIYDGLLANGVKPFVELSFMPKKLAARMDVHQFWYRPIVSPPRSWERWDALIDAFTRHLVQRYGEDEVAQWYFEVWNEPNIHFWTGKPKEKTYYELYDHTARAIKRVSVRLRVGGPATAQAAWIDRFLAHAVTANIPVDFVSTHVYANDTAHDVFGTDEKLGRREMVCRAMRKVHDQVKASARPATPIIWSEFNASWKNEPEITDALMMGPWLADTIRQCDGLVESAAYWAFSDVFEEQGVVGEPMYGGYGAIAAGHLPKPAFSAFSILHALGTERLPSASNDALVTRRADGTVVVALWNLSLPGEHHPARTVELKALGLSTASIARVDATHGSLLAAYEQMGRPRYPTVAQEKQLRDAAKLPPPERARLTDGKLAVQLPENGLAVIELR